MEIFNSFHVTEKIVGARFWPAFSLVLKFLFYFIGTLAYSHVHRRIVDTLRTFKPDPPSPPFVSRKKRNERCWNYSPSLNLADEHSKHTLSDAPLVSVPKKKLKGNYNRWMPRDISQSATVKQAVYPYSYVIVLFLYFYLRDSWLIIHICTSNIVRTTFTWLDAGYRLVNKLFDVYLHISGCINSHAFNRTWK
jgi:hypothetical protein